MAGEKGPRVRKDLNVSPGSSGALGFRDRKETDVLQLICSVSLIAKRDFRGRRRARGRLLKFGIWV